MKIIKKMPDYCFIAFFNTKNELETILTPDGLVKPENVKFKISNKIGDTHTSEVFRAVSVTFMNQKPVRIGVVDSEKRLCYFQSATFEMIF